MGVDQHGLSVTVAGATALSHYVRAVDDLLHFRESVIDRVDAALSEDPTFPMAAALQAYLGLLTTESTDAAQARKFLAGFRTAVDEDALLPRERAHLAAARAGLNGDLHRASRILRDLTIEHPRDALALAIGHQLDFFLGDATSLRDRIGGVLSAWNPDDAHYSNLLGMYAFGLEECGHYVRAEEAGLEAVERDPKDVWGIHAVVHTYEMQARFGDGIRFLDARTEDWTVDTFLNVHNWWHYSLYALESGDVARALFIYDTVLHTPRSAGTAMEMLDASALLWRLYLADDPDRPESSVTDQTARWATLAEAWQPVVAEPFYSFNDAHAMMAYIGSGQFGLAEALIDDRIEWLRQPNSAVTNQVMTVRVGLPVCRALLAFGKGDYDETVRLLYPIRGYVNEFGGSHVQRDAVYRTLLEAALRAKRLPLARSLISERIHIRPRSPYNWLKQAQLARALGEEAAASEAEQRAAALVQAAVG